GAGLMLAAALVLLLALNWGGSRHAWTSLPILGLVGASAALWALFAARLVRAPEPFIPWSMVRDPVIGAIVAAGFCCIGVSVGLSVFSPLYLRLVLGLSASASGLALIAFMAGATVGSLTA